MWHRKNLIVVMTSLLALLLIAGDHPLVEHWNDVASSNVGIYGSKWIHTGTSGIRYGLWGESASIEARAIYGQATSTDGSGLAIGVFGEFDSPTGRGVHAFASNTDGIN